MRWTLNIPSALFRLASQKTGGDPKVLNEVIVRFLTQWATGNTAQAKAGRVRAARITPEERREWGRRGAASRWGTSDPDADPND